MRPPFFSLPLHILIGMLAIFCGLYGSTTTSYSHALQPGYLEIRLIEKDHYAVAWKVPAVKARAMPITAQLPEQCEHRTPGQAFWNGTAYVTRWTTICSDGLEGGRIEIVGLDRTATDVLVRYDLADGSNQTQRLTANNISFEILSEPNSFEVVQTFFLFGIEHILLGIDHLMFVLILLLLVKSGRRIVATVTAFTIAHSLTLAGATLGLVHVPGPPIEATIALSIVFVASEVVHSRRGRPGLTERYPWLVAFSFGLLHGFGFAGALTDIGLPQKSVPLALAFFNIGVEVGQLLFVASVLVIFAFATWIMRVAKTPKPEWSWSIIPYTVGSLAVFWVLQRINGFWMSV